MSLEPENLESEMPENDTANNLLNKNKELIVNVMNKNFMHTLNNTILTKELYNMMDISCKNFEILKKFASFLNELTNQTYKFNFGEEKFIDSIFRKKICLYNNGFDFYKFNKKINESHITEEYIGNLIYASTFEIYLPLFNEIGIKQCEHINNYTGTTQNCDQCNRRKIFIIGLFKTSNFFNNMSLFIEEYYLSLCKFEEKFKLTVDSLNGPFSNFVVNLGKDLANGFLFNNDKSP
jgi:hypothetical protein